MDNEINFNIENNSIENKKTSKKKILIFSIIAVLVLGVGFITYNYLNKNNDSKMSVAELEAYLKENYSKYVIDGSTSMIPLHEALEEKFGEGKEIKHSKTVSAFENFVDGKIDILLAVDYLDSYFESAKDKNVVINKKEITKEALVFLKNKELEVDNLTLDDIKKIYNKEITNWGNFNEKYSVDNGGTIIPIYRNEDSGSGMALIKLLGKNNINCDEDDCLFINDMGGVINALASGLNSFNSIPIAYNMYTFSEKQYHHENVKSFKINGVEPNDETIYNEEYPVLLYNYIYYKDDKAKEFGEKLYEYLLTDEGQKIIMENGYVPLKKQNDVPIKDTERNCKDNFVDEFCVKNEGYNEEIGKYVKITIDNKSEKYEYFDTVEEYIFANSNITREQFDKLKDLLSYFISSSDSKFLYADNITFDVKESGDIELYTGFCGGSFCILMNPNETYNFDNQLIDTETDFSIYHRVLITKDLKTIYAEKTENQRGFSIPLEDFSKAFTLESSNP